MELDLLKKYLIAFSPLRAKKTWIGINIICIAYTFVLFIEIMFMLEPLAYQNGTRVYLGYNCGTTLIWVLQIGSTVLDNMQTMNRRDSLFEFIYFQSRQDMELLAQLAVALYFLVVSLVVFVIWFNNDMDVEGMNRGRIIQKIIINFAAYLYQLVKMLREGDGVESRIEVGSYSERDGYIAVADIR